MWPYWVSNPGPLTYESGALPIALRGPAHSILHNLRFASFSSVLPYIFSPSKSVARMLAISEGSDNVLTTVGLLIENVWSYKD